MAFTTWAALRTELKDAIQEHVTNGKALVGMATVNGRQMQYNGVQSVLDLIQMTYKMEALDNGSSLKTRRSFGQFRRRF